MLKDVWMALGSGSKQSPTCLPAWLPVPSGQCQVRPSTHGLLLPPPQLAVSVVLLIKITDIDTFRCAVARTGNERTK